jgi:phosphatidylethanolamine-binding protein (PEBP) family uncharacterized protein
MAFVPVGNEGALNGTTPVTIMAAPAAATQRIVRNILINNRDTAVVTVILRKLKGASTFVLKTIDLDAEDAWEFDHVIVLDATDESITAVMTGAPATNQPHFDTAAGDHS